MTYHSSANESVRLGVSRDTDLKTRTALAAFCRRNGYPYLFTEVLEPLLSGHGLVLALAVTERPWPPTGIGSQTIEAVGIAMIGTEGRAHLTPVLTDRRNATNIGLVAALTKQLLEHLHETDVPSASYLVRQATGHSSAPSNAPASPRRTSNRPPSSPTTWNSPPRPTRSSTRWA